MTVYTFDQPNPGRKLYLLLQNISMLYTKSRIFLGFSVSSYRITRSNGLDFFQVPFPFKNLYFIYVSLIQILFKSDTVFRVNESVLTFFLTAGQHRKVF